MEENRIWVSKSVYQFLNMLPIIISHVGSEYYVQLCIDSITRFGVTPVLIGTSGFANCRFVNNESVNDGVAAFRNAYVHKSPNSPRFEKLCYERWFYTRNFMVKNSINKVILFDSDVLVAASPDEIEDFSDGKIMITADDCNHDSCGISVMTLDVVKHMCDMMIEIQGSCGNDMELFVHVRNRHGLNIKRGNIPKDGKAMDHNLHACLLWERTLDSKTSIPIKKIVYEKGRPYGFHNTAGKVRLLNMHFWDGLKKSMSDAFQKMVHST